jgi:IMP dehydrogenase
MMFRQTLSLDDVLLEPQFSSINSRSEIDISSEFSLDLTLELPIISSPMDTVTGPAMAVEIAEAGGLGILHRYASIEEQIKWVDYCVKKGHQVGAAVGVSGDFLDRAQANYYAGAKVLCIDVAHGHHSKVRDAIKTIRKELGSEPHIMAGNVATANAFRDLSEWGANSIRVGLGGGSICSTRIQTGHGIPTFQSVLDCVQIASEYDVALIADGGIRTSGDIVKMLAAGADAVMCGSLLAGTEEAPGQTIEDTEGRLWKIYRGMASKEAQVAWKGSYNSYEGVTSRIPCRGPVRDVLQDLERGIRSGFSYSGARNLVDLYTMGKFIRQTSAGLIESQTHIINRKW